MFVGKNKSINSVWVLGANSEVAVSICIELAKKSCKKFYLISRNEAKIKKFSNYLKKTFSVEVEEKILELTYFPGFDDKSFYKVDDFDLYLITAGYLGNVDLASTNYEESQKIINSNFTGIIPWINSIASPERIKQKRSIWVFTSVAADRGRPSNYFYGAAKAGLQIFCEGLLLKCHGKPFSIRIIKAGYIYTHMTIGKVPAILCVKPHKVAKMLLRNPYKRGIEYLPWWWKLIMLMVKNLPSKFASRL
tara:strand:+ start:642 stop:1388 length:747 start_codon:yes stop_codon:yes gene_type:complete